MTPTRWHPHFAWLPRWVDGRWRWMEWLQRRLVFTPVGPGRLRGIEEFRK